MTPPLRLDQIRVFDWKSHVAALWWLGVLYRRPTFLQQALAAEPRGIAIRRGVVLYLHALPYLAVASVLLNAAVLSLNHIQWTWSKPVFDVAVGIAVGIAFGIAFGITGGIAFGIAVGIAFGIAGGITGGIAGGITGGIAFGIAGGIAVGIAFGIAGGIAVGIAVGIANLRAYYFLAHPLLIWPRVRGGVYRYHPVAWDDLCSVPFPGLDRLLVAFTESNPLGGGAEVERLINSYPSQRMQALRARMILLARESKQLSTLDRLHEIAARLPEGQTTLLYQCRKIADDMQEISALQTRLNTIERPVLRFPYAQLLVREIASFRDQIAGFKQPLAIEFRAAAVEWAKIAHRQLDEARCILGREPVGQVFRAGDPVKREQEAFVYRDAVVGRLDQQVMLATGCPGIVLYARRRMGKTTFLTNLEGFMPPSVVIRTFSMQNASLFASMEHFVDAVTEGQANDLAGLATYLATEDKRLRTEGKRLLLTLDEYEGIDEKIGGGVFPKDLLATLRESIQQHRQIIWLFAGSHEITELRHAEWPSYLISARTIEVPFFSLDETRLLLTDPLKHSPVFQDAGERPRFAPDLWGVNGIERIHEQAGGWPHLVQLIAETLVTLLNERGKPSVTPQLMEMALDEASISGQNVLLQLMREECTLPGEWRYLSAFREAEEQDPPEDEALRRSVLRRQLILESGGRWRLRAPLMARWLRLRG